MFYTLIFCELLQGLTALVFGASDIHFEIAGIKLCAGFLLNGGIVSNGIILLLPFVITILAIESSVKLLKRYSPGFKRYFTVIFSICLSGFLLFDSFYSAFSVVLRFNYQNDWVQLVALSDFTEGGRIAFVFFMIILTAGYLNLSSKRIIKYINIQ